MSHSHVRPVHQGLALIAATGLGLSLAACSSDSKNSAAPSPSSKTATSHASPSRTSAPPVLSDEDTSTINTLVGLDPSGLGDQTGSGDQPGGGGMTGILPPGESIFFSTEAGPAGTYGVKVGCIGGVKAAKLTATIHPKGMDEKTQVTVPFDCPKGPHGGYGKTVFTGKLSKSSAVELHNGDSMPVKYGMSIRPVGKTA